MISFSMHPRRLVTSVCPIIGDDELIHLIKVLPSDAPFSSSEIVCNLWVDILRLWILFLYNISPVVLAYIGDTCLNWFYIWRYKLVIFLIIMFFTLAGWNFSIKKNKFYSPLIFWTSGFLVFMQGYNLLLSFFFLMHKLSSFGQWLLQAGSRILLTWPHQSWSTPSLSNTRHSSSPCTLPTLDLKSAISLWSPGDGNNLFL